MVNQALLDKVLAQPQQLTDLLRRNSRVANDIGCIEYTKGKTDKDYRRLSVWAGGRHHKVWAHRLAWMSFHKKTIPAGHEIDHICNNRWCINIHHLEMVTKQENLLRRGNNGNHGEGIPFNDNEISRCTGQEIPF